MFVTGLIIAIECVVCHIVMQPTQYTSTEIAQWIMLLINMVVLWDGLCRAFDNRSTVAVKVQGLKDPQPEREIVKTVLIVSFMLRLLILMWDVYARDIFILPNSEGDAQAYFEISSSYAWGGRRNTVDLGHFPFYTGQLFKYIGQQRLTVQFINMYLAMCSLVMVYRILCKLGISPEVREKTMLIAAFLPNLMMITTFFLQESVISFCIITALYMFTCWWKKGGLLYLALTVAFSLLGSLLHMGALVVALGTLVMLALVGNKERHLKISVSKIVMMVVIGFAFLLVLVSSGDTFTGKIRGEDGLTAESILYEVNVRTDGGASYSVGIQGLPPAVDLVVNTPIRMVYFIFSPLPWMWRGLGDILAFFGSTIFYFYAFYVAYQAYRAHPIKGIPDSNLGGFLVVLTVIMALAAVMFGWGVANAGSALRHREKFTYICLVITAVSNEILVRTGKADEKRKQKEKHRIGHRAHF
ncbi:MAG: glycosyltransferase family 39 protein [Clostridia bacterium]|nr:glycosyltransferase family 39 protein [Clostridia bacterium]